jgi:hypothetical protein
LFAKPQKDAKGQFLLDHVFKYLGLTETDFFGLRFTDSKNEKVGIEKVREKTKT